MTACFAFGTEPHSWQWVSQGKSTIAHKGMVLAAKTIAATAMDLFKNPSHVAAAKQDHFRQRRGKPYVCPIPKDAKPPLHARNA